MFADLEAVRHWGLLCHSACFVIIGLVLTPRLPNDMISSHPNLPLLMKMTMIFYIFDVLVILEKKRRSAPFKLSMICDSMVYHHVVAFIFCGLFVWYQQGHAHYQFFAWNEIAPTFHMLAYWIPKNHKYRNHYQLFYLFSYCISYLIVTYYLLTCNHYYYYSPDYKEDNLVSMYLPRYHDPGIWVFVLALVGLQILWLYQAFSALMYVWSKITKGKLS